LQGEKERKCREELIPETLSEMHFMYFRQLLSEVFQKTHYRRHYLLWKIYFRNSIGESLFPNTFHTF